MVEYRAYLTNKEHLNKIVEYMTGKLVFYPKLSPHCLRVSQEVSWTKKTAPGKLYVFYLFFLVAHTKNRAAMVLGWQRRLLAGVMPTKVISHFFAMHFG